jgi:hypothetical protein
VSITICLTRLSNHPNASARRAAGSRSVSPGSVAFSNEDISPTTVVDTLNTLPMPPVFGSLTVTPGTPSNARLFAASRSDPW